MKRLNWKLLALCSAAFVLSAAVAWGAYGAMPHLEDEHANLFQARVFARGDLTATAPRAQPRAFFIPFILTDNHQLFSKYPPGYSLLLAPGALIGQPWLITALASALTVLAVYLLGRDLFDANMGLLAAALGSIAPMFVLLSGALLSHVPAMALLIFFAWGFVRARRSCEQHPLRFAAFTGAMLGLAAITRPWTTIAIGLPFAIQALIDLVQRRGAPSVWRAYALMLGVTILIAQLLPLYNYFTTGSALTNTYALWWPTDRLGFGPGTGMTPGGHSLKIAILNFQLDFVDFGPMALGGPTILGVAAAWGLILAALLLPPLSKRDWALMLPVLLLIAAQFLYWARGSSLYGPRYYAEAMPFLWLLGARGLIKLCQFKWPRRVVYVVLPLLIAATIVYTLEPRFLQSFVDYRSARRDINAIGRANLHHALVFVRARVWSDYANLGWLNDIHVDDGNIIYVHDIDPLANQVLIDAYPDRKVYYYDRTQTAPLVAARDR